MKIVQTLKILIFCWKESLETTKNETNKQKVGFLSMLLCTLRARLLGSILAGKRIVRAGSGRLFWTPTKKEKTL